MFRSLLEERFKLKVRAEDKPMPVYLLTVGKNGPKLRAAVDDGRSGVIAMSANGVMWHSISMDYLAAWLSNLPQMGRPVLDRTGLSGAYDFTLARFDGMPDKRAEVESRSQTGDSGDSSIFSALADLGLKLEVDKAPVTSYTVEHVDKLNTN